MQMVSSAPFRPLETSPTGLFIQAILRVFDEIADFLFSSLSLPRWGFPVHKLFANDDSGARAKNEIKASRVLEGLNELIKNRRIKILKRFTFTNRFIIYLLHLRAL
jgi:hypothetical protein